MDFGFFNFKLLQFIVFRQHFVTVVSPYFPPVSVVSDFEALNPLFNDFWSPFCVCRRCVKQDLLISPQVNYAFQLSLKFHCFSFVLQDWLITWLNYLWFYNNFINWNSVLICHLIYSMEKNSAWWVKFWYFLDVCQASLILRVTKD